MAARANSSASSKSPELGRARTPLRAGSWLTPAPNPCYHRTPANARTLLAAPLTPLSPRQKFKLLPARPSERLRGQVRRSIHNSSLASRHLKHLLDLLGKNPFAGHPRP